tara:strand:+ start:169 stop:678 length:510 start_codon:yes stop_codon:yes gene_type:complete
MEITIRLKPKSNGRMGTKGANDRTLYTQVCVKEEVPALPEAGYQRPVYEYKPYDMAFTFELDDKSQMDGDAREAFISWLTSDLGASRDFVNNFDVSLEYEATSYSYSFKKEFYGTLDAEECADNNITSDWEAEEYVQSNYETLYPEEGDVVDTDANEEFGETITKIVSS